MHFVIAHNTEITDAARSWGDQPPALELDLLGFGILVALFLRWLKEMGEESRAEREALDSLFTETIAEFSERCRGTGGAVPSSAGGGGVHHSGEQRGHRLRLLGAGAVDDGHT